MDRLLIVGAGGFFGAILRYVAGGFFQRLPAFPAGTLFVNFTGSLALGYVMYLSEYRGLFDQQTRLFLTVGVLGAYTTMSTFGYESLRLLEENQVTLFAANVAGTILLVILAVYLGRMLALYTCGG